MWQRYGYERVLRNDEATLVVARYILENPLRAGLVKSVPDDPFIGSQNYRSRRSSKPLQISAAAAVGPAEAGRYVRELVRLKADTTYGNWSA